VEAKDPEALALHRLQDAGHNSAPIDRRMKEEGNSQGENIIPYLYN